MGCSDHIAEMVILKDRETPQILFYDILFDFAKFILLLECFIRMEEVMGETKTSSPFVVCKTCKVKTVIVIAFFTSVIDMWSCGKNKANISVKKAYVV